MIKIHSYFNGTFELNIENIEQTYILNCDVNASGTADDPNFQLNSEQCSGFPYSETLLRLDYSFDLGNVLWIRYNETTKKYSGELYYIEGTTELFQASVQVTKIEYSWPDLSDKKFISTETNKILMFNRTADLGDGLPAYTVTMYDCSIDENTKTCTVGYLLMSTDANGKIGATTPTTEAAWFNVNYAPQISEIYYNNGNISVIGDEMHSGTYFELTSEWTLN